MRRCVPRFVSIGGGVRVAVCVACDRTIDTLRALRASKPRPVRR